jgi:acetyl esterase/lipase
MRLVYHPPLLSMLLVSCLAPPPPAHDLPTPDRSDVQTNAASPRHATRVEPESHGWVAWTGRPTKLVLEAPAPQTYAPIDELPPGVREVTYPSGELELKGWYMASRSKGAAPTLVYLHGGFAFGLSDLADVEPFHDAGFNLFAPAWRGENGNPGAHELAYGEVDDAIAAISWVRGQPGVDPDRVHVLGHSAGGMIASLLAVVPDLPVAETASVGGIYAPDAILQFPNLPFDTTNPDEARFRSLLPFLPTMARPHVAYVGTQDTFLRMGLPSFRDSGQSKLEIVDVDGDHFGSLGAAVMAYLARVK